MWNKNKVITSCLIIITLSSLFFLFPKQTASASIFNPLFSNGAETPMYLPITTSNDINYNSMVQGNYSAYFKTDSMSSQAVLMQINGYNFTQDISTSQLHWYNSTYNAIIGMVNEMNPQHTILNTTNGVLTYKNAWINTTLQYEPNVSNLKETLIINSVSAPSSSIKPDYLQYAANFYYNNNLTIYADGIGYLHPSNQRFSTYNEIHFNGANNQTLAFLPIPFVYDNAGNQTSGYYAVTANNGILIINIRIPKTFIDSAIYPLFFDPTFSDGFESGDATAWSGGVGSANAIQNSIVHSGNYAINFSSYATSQEKYYTFASAPTTLYYRQYFQLDQIPYQNSAYVSIAKLTNTTGALIWRLYIQNSSGNINIVLNYYFPSSNYIIYTTSPALTAHTWYCIEVGFVEHAATGSFTVWLNGNQIGTAINKDTSKAGTVNKIFTGEFNAAPTTGWNNPFLYIDDCVADTSYIGPMPSTVSLTFNSSPAGEGYITVNGTAQTTPYTIASATIGDVYTIEANSPVAITWGNKYAFDNWNDSGAQSHAYTVSIETTITATFTQQLYLLNGVAANQINAIDGIAITNIYSVNGVP